jgi:putative DNA primase/helicase
MQQRWCVWRRQERDGKLSKVPYQGHASSQHASSTKPRTWCDLQTCQRAYEAERVDGIGFALTDSDIAALDIDDCRNKETGELHPWAAALVARSSTYCEVTPSGEGIRIIGCANGAHVHRKLAVADGVSCELYRKAKRFITVTGEQIGGATELANIDQLIEETKAELEDSKQRARKQRARKQKAAGGANMQSATGASKHPAGAATRRDLAALIKDGCGDDFGGDRSRAVWFAINEMLRRGEDHERIVATIIDPQNGIAESVLGKPDPEKYAREQVAKAVQEAKEADQNDGDIDAELERLARLSRVAYERARRQAADELKFRSAMLDRLVGAKRIELGLAEDKLAGSAVNFPEPEPWPEPVDGAALLDEISSAIARHVVLPERAAALTALWAVHTYLFELFHVTPRLGLVSPTKRCGKTTLLDVLNCLVARPLLSAHVTSSAVFRVIQEHRPCFLIDETDTFLGKNDELRGVLNSGHAHNGKVLRSVGDDHEPRGFSTFSPCALAAIGKLPPTLMDRSIVVDLKRRLPDEPITPFRSDRAGHLETLARKIARWVGDHAAALREADPVMPAGVFNREADNLRPLLAIADEAGGAWPERARAAGGEGRQPVGDDGDRLELLLTDISGIFDELGVERVSSGTMVERLCAIEGRPWAEYGRSRKPITQNTLATLLRKLKITPGQVRFSSDDSRKGYKRHQFDDAFARFLPEGGFEPKHRNKRDEIRTTEHFQTETNSRGVSVEKCEESNNDGLCFSVSVGSGKNGSGGKKAASELSAEAIVELAAGYDERLFDDDGRLLVRTAVADAELRAILSVMVRAGRVEAEFQRIMERVFPIPPPRKRKAAPAEGHGPQQVRRTPPPSHQPIAAARVPVRSVGDCPPETLCLHCYQPGGVQRIVNAALPGSKAETLHLSCAQWWFARC